jgi:hypothetical protein
MMRLLLGWLISCCCFGACVHEPVDPFIPIPPPQPAEQWEYLFLAHPRHNNKDLQRVDSAVEKINFDRFDMVLLGGDLTANSSREDSSLTYLDGIFNLGSPQTLLAPGNHDVDNLPLLLQYTGRPSFYSYHQNGVTFVVWDTQKDKCNIYDEQLDILQNIADTLTHSDQLVIIHHKLLWLPGHPELEPQIGQLSNAGLCPYEFCLFENNFWQDVYPLLQQVKAKGKQVILIGGDMGFRSKYFEYQTLEGIVFLGSGIDQGDDDNEVLIFKKDSETRILRWERFGVRELVGS